MIYMHLFVWTCGITLFYSGKSHILGGKTNSHIRIIFYNIISLFWVYIRVSLWRLLYYSAYIQIKMKRSRKQVNSSIRIRLDLFPEGFHKSNTAQ